MKGSKRPQGRPPGHSRRGFRKNHAGAHDVRKSARKSNPLSRAWQKFMKLFSPAGPKVPISSPRLYIGNLSYDTAESDLREFFTKAGNVKSAEIIWDRAMNRSRGFAFVEMNTVAEAEKAARMFHDKEFMGRKLIVSGAKGGGERKSREPRE